jgi:hypothetical protein
MHALVVAHGQCAVHDEAVGIVIGIGVVVGGASSRGNAGARLVHAVVLAVVRVGAKAGGNGVTGVPVDGEIRASSYYVSEYCHGGEVDGCRSTDHR